MKFYGAITAVVQDPESLQLEAVTGWAVLEDIQEDVQGKKIR